MTGHQSPCKTLDYPLAGSLGYTPDFWKQLLENHAFTAATAQHLAEKFGTLSRSVLELAGADASLLQPIFKGGAPIRAEVVYAVRAEMAQTIEDVLCRRTGVQFHSWREAERAAPVVAQIIGRELDWSEAQTRDAVENYVASINRLLRSAGIEHR